MASALGLSLSWPSENLIARGIFDADGNKIEPCDDYPEGNCLPVARVETGFRDIVPLRTLLRASGISDLDTFGDVECAPDDVSPGCESARYAGLVLQVNIECRSHRLATGCSGSPRLLRAHSQRRPDEATT